MSKTLLIVSGLSGAGHSTCLNLLEDLGFEAVDNMPANLLPDLIANRDSADLAIGIDSRTRHALSAQTLQYLQQLQQSKAYNIQILFLECQNDVLERRFVVTRRKHPLHHIGRLNACIEHERTVLAPLKDMADHVLDTSRLLPSRLKDWLQAAFAATHGLRIHVLSFSYKKGLPSDVDLVFDMRFVQNPFYDEALRSLNGTQLPVQQYIETDQNWQTFQTHTQQQLQHLLPAYLQEGKATLTIAFGCTGGQHRSVYAAENFGHWLISKDYNAHIWHQDL